MRLSRRKNLLIAAAFGAGQLIFSCAAQTAETNFVFPKADSSVVKAPLPPPPIPVAKSPVELFRELLAMNITERKVFLTNRSPESQKRILAKVREYESLKPDERELRLQATELSWYLLPLMGLSPTNRPAQLVTIPADMRKLVEVRLQLWDTLTSDVQKELLESELVIRYFAQPEAGTNQTQQILASISGPRREKLEAGITNWLALPEAKRQRMLKRFNQFFELTATEKQKALATLSDAERQQMKNTLEAFEKLPKAQRTQCIRSFEKFTCMSLAERQQFLKNAERWQRMSRAEREAWRKLVKNVPELPPLPLGFDSPPLPLPGPRGVSSPVVTTNAY